jgi:D-sedoheptulose 7-phosphate isomerase
MREMIVQCFKESAKVKLLSLEENLEKIIAVSEAIAYAFKKGGKLLLFGNGGSAADAQHLTAEFVNRFLIERPPLPAIALTTDTSIITSVSNDYRYGDIFVRQIYALGKKEDIAWGISVSGKSSNVVDGLKMASRMEMVTIGLTGGNGGEIARIVDYHLNVPSDSTPRVQEAHITIGHIICEMVDYQLFQKPGKDR